jgi:hypothetical protein
MEEKLRYKCCGDYLIPDIKLSSEETIQLGKYGRLRREYLRKNAPFLYSDLVLTEKLFPYLKEIDETAQSRLEGMQAELLQRNPAPDKKAQQLAWVQHMNVVKAQAEEIIFAELIYA